jgi:hypothetical protein
LFDFRRGNAESQRGRQRPERQFVPDGARIKTGVPARDDFEFGFGVG